MPVFNWDGNDVPILKPGFGYYMAVTLPLTCIVLIIWGLSMRIRLGKRIWPTAQLRRIASPLVEVA